MSLHEEPPAYSALQRTVFDATGIVVDAEIDQGEEGCFLQLEGVPVLSVPQEAIQNPASFFRSFEFPRHFNNGPTLKERQAILAITDMQTHTHFSLFFLMEDVPTHDADVKQVLGTIRRLERQAHAALCVLVWNLDDITLTRWTKMLEP